MKKWFKTKNNHILDFENLQAFWIEGTLTVRVFAEDLSKTVWNIAEFDSLPEAQLYFDSIFEILKKNGE